MRSANWKDLITTLTNHYCSQMWGKPAVYDRVIQPKRFLNSSSVWDYFSSNFSPNHEITNTTWSLEPCWHNLWINKSSVFLLRRIGSKLLWEEWWRLETKQSPWRAFWKSWYRDKRVGMYKIEKNVKITTAATPQRTCVAQRKGSVVYKHHGIVTTHLFSRSSGDWGD